MNPAKGIPVGDNGVPMQGLPAPIIAKQVFASENATTSSVVTLTQDTTAIEVAAIGGPAVIKWIATGNTGASVISAAGTANYDHVIPTATYRRFVVPREAPATQGSSMVGINRQYGLYQRLAYKSIGIASILTAEF